MDHGQPNSVRLWIVDLTSAGFSDLLYAQPPGPVDSALKLPTHIILPPSPLSSLNTPLFRGALIPIYRRSTRCAMDSPDYIIIGGGTSGLVVANRISEDPNVRVLVLEAGKDLTTDPRVNIPALFTTLLGSDAAWQCQTLPQPGLGGRSIKEPQGKAVGGSSAINGQAFIAPAQADIDAWAKLGNPGWDWAGLVPSYKKSYTLIPPPDQATRDHLGLDWIDSECHGTAGPIKVSFPGTVHNPLCKAWIDAFRGLNKVTNAGM